VVRSRVELFEQIRRDRRASGLSIRELAEEHHVHGAPGPGQRGAAAEEVSAKAAACD
jgi:hypothetical protein